MASPEPLQPYRQVQSAAEKDLARILGDTAKAIEDRVKLLRPGVGGVVRKAQLNATLAAVRKLQRQMWIGKIDPMLIKAVEAAEKAGEDTVEALQRVAYAGLPEAVADVLIRGLKASAVSGLASDRARKRRALSRMVYRQAAFHGDKLEGVIRQGIISNLSARELAKDAREYVDPKTKGGASYAAMRLARTEINNALHERQIAGAKRPGVKAVKWNLSGSHRVPDLCNVYAGHGGNGHWAPDSIPDKPHPQCFCYLTYVMLPADDFVKKLESGGFDDEIDRRTKANLERLGQPVSKSKSVSKPKKSTKAVTPPKTTVKTKSSTSPKKTTKRTDGFVSGKWQRSGLSDDIAKMAKQLETAASAEKRIKQVADNGPDWATKMATMLLGGLEEDNDVSYSNGPHRIRFTGGLSDVEQQEFLTYVDRMESSFPTGHHMHINMAGSDQFDKGVGGETTIGTGSMFLNETIMRMGRWPGMPASKDVNSALYVLAHEWGHALSTLDEADDKHTHRHAIDAGGMTRYGRTGSDGVLAPREGYAEAFAEWALTEGKTTNAAARVYAEKYKWGERFGF